MLKISFSPIAGARSLLLSRYITSLFWALSRERIFMSSSVRGCDESSIAMTSSASSMYRSAFFTPIFSTASLVSRMPAVSMMRSGTPAISACSSMLSLVVPGTSVTIARSSRSM